MLFRNSVLIAIVIFIGSAAFADSVKGTLTVDKKVIELKKIYFEYVEDPNDAKFCFSKPQDDKLFPLRCLKKS